MKKLLSLLLAVMMVVSLLPVSAFAEMAQGETVEQTPEPVVEPQADESTLVTSGKAGDNITWSYDEATKVLTFSGKGEMMDNKGYDFETIAPYFIYPVEKVVVEEGITSIGTAMIYFGSDIDPSNDNGNDTVTAIELPSTLTSIHTSAFGGFNKLEKAVIPDSVTTIGNIIFELSSGIKELVLPDSITTIYTGTYSSLRGLEKIVVPKNVTEIPERAFAYLKADITLPSGLKKIGKSAFAAGSTKEVTIPASVTEIGDQAFYYWKADQTINFELTEEEVKSKVTFGSDWSGKATIKYGVGSSDDGSIKFNVTSNVKNLNLTVMYKGASEVQVPYEMEKDTENNCYFSIPDYAYNNPDYRIKKISITIDGKTLTYVVYSDGIGSDAMTAAFGDSFKPNKSGNNWIELDFFDICGTVNSNVDVYIEAEELGNKVGDNVTWSYDEATKVLTFSGEGDMYDEEALLMPYSTYPVEKVVIGEGITGIGTYKLCFVSDRETFARNSTLKEIVYPSSIKTISTKAFCRLSGFETFTIPEGIEEIQGGQLFGGCSGIKEVILPSTLKSLNYIFNGLKDIEKIVIPESITEIPASIFYGMTKLSSVNLPATLTKIGKDAFNGCTAVKEITIPASVTEIGSKAFYNWTADQTINFELTEEEVAAKVTLGGGWNSNATVKYGVGVTLVTSGKAGENIDWNYDEATKTLTFTGTGEMYDGEGKATAMEYASYPVEKVVIGEGITNVGKYKLHFVTVKGSEMIHNTTLKSIEFPSTIKTLNQYAFGYIDGIEVFAIPEGVENVTKVIFTACDGIKEVTLPSTFKKASRYVYAKLDNLERVVIPEGQGITELPMMMLKGHPNLKSVTLPEGITKIGSSAFTDCPKLTELVLPEAVTEIGNSAFSGCTGISEIIIPENVTSIGNNAFMNWTADQIIRFTITEEEANAKITFGTAWSGSATIRYKGDEDKFAGEKIRWSWDEESKTLTFSGNGNMYDYTGKTTPWHDLKPETINFSGNITGIGAYSLVFDDGSSVKTINLVNTIASIGNGAFKGLTGVTEFVVPESVTAIGSKAFSGWTAEQTVRFNATESEVKAALKLAEDWDQDCAAKFVYKQESKWAEGLELSAVKDGKTYAIRLDLKNEIATVYGDPFEGSVSFAGAVITGVQNSEAWKGSAAFSEDAAAAGASDKYTAEGTITITSENEGNAVLTFGLEFEAVGYFYPMVGGVARIGKGVNSANISNKLLTSGETKFTFVTNQSEFVNTTLRFSVYAGATVTSDWGTVSFVGGNVYCDYTIAFERFALGDSMNITITNALGMSKTFEFTISKGYRVTVTQANGGNISATQKYGDVFEVAPGAVIYLNADPEPGMVIEEWSVEGVNTNPVVTIDNEDPNSASFVMINENVNVTAVFRPLKEGETDTGFRIKSVTLENGVAFIDEANATVKIMLNKDGDKSKVKPIIEVTEGATISPASGEEVDFTKNGSDTVKYTVSRNGGSHEYTFTAQINKLEKGTGTQSDPFRIENVDDLIAFRDSVNAGASFEGYYVVQTADLDLSQFGDQWVPIGTAVANNSYGSNPGKAFMGTYDGQNHKILNMRYISEDTDMCKGFFGTLKNATVKNLVIDSSCYVKTAIYVGGVAGLAVNSTFENCVNSAEIYSTGNPVKGGSDSARSFAGGICGKAESGCVFIRCSNSGRIACNETRSGFGYKGPRGTGGISGDGGTFIFCNNSGSISGGQKTGGISGNGTAIGCWNTGDVRGYYEFLTAPQISSATSCVGGIVGEGTAESCYNKGTVSDNWLGVGGIVGSGTANNCYNTGAVATEYDGNFSQAIGAVVGYTNGGSADMKNLYYTNYGEIEAIGYDNKTGSGTAGNYITEEELRGSDVLEALISYTTASLEKVEWMADINNNNEGYPVIWGYSTVKSPEKKILSAKMGNRIGAIDEEKGTVSFVTNYGEDVSSVALNITVSAGAAVSPASGERVDFSKGPVTYTVTAADGSTRDYIVTVTVPSSPDGIADIYIGFYNRESTGSPNSSLLEKGEFRQDKYEYTVEMNDSRIYAAVKGLGNFRILEVPSSKGASVTASINGGEAKSIENSAVADPNTVFNKNTNISYADNLCPGKNTLVITVTNPGSTESVTYTINIILHPTIKEFAIKNSESSISPAFDNNVEEYTITIQDATTELPITFKTSFENSRNLVNVTVPDGTVAFSKSDYSGNAIYEGNVTITPEMNEFQITVAGTAEGAESKTYTFKLNRIGTYEVEFTSNVENAVIRVYDKDGNKLTPDENGKYIFTRGETYFYTAAARGYVSAAGTVTSVDQLTDGKFVINLEKVSGVKYPELGAYWPTFRGNDENMAVTSVKTPTSESETSLLWANKAGIGYNSGAVSSPIIVGGYIYAYAGASIMKIDKQTGVTVAAADMVGSSSFSIVPPTYADGMIFVGLSGGRVQAFRADTLESLWVYKDELGGQPNSQIIYKDGCVYTGFWVSESKNANFVCIDASDEDPTNPTEEKYALWTYTQAGGFYWAGAYATDKFIVVTTDDGKSDSNSTGSSIIVFDKDTGAKVSSIDNLYGDLRSNVAYDKDSNRVYFTSKGGYLYSVAIDWTTGEIDASGLKSIALGGMSTSTPVVYKGRVYVGVSGSGQFSAYSGHNITVIDINTWTIAYRAYTKGYPQTSALVSSAYEGSDGYTYVYFTENYTPGAIRYIKDKAGQTALVDGVMENGQLCAPILYTPGENLAQYCICSPIVDESGTMFFKNDTGYMMAVSVTAESLEIAQKPSSITENGDGTVTTEGMKVYVVLKNGEKVDVSKYVTVTADGGASYKVTYTYGSEIAEGVKTLTASFTDENRVAAKAVEDLIAAIGKVELTDECKAKIDAARAAYDKLTDAQKKLVSNYDVLTAAEEEYQKLLDQKKADEAAAKAVEDLIAAIGKVELTDESKAKIDEARAAYDKLTEAQKKFVSNYDVLTAAEAKYEQLVNQAAADHVKELVESLVPVTANSGKALEEARKAFDALTPEQKKLLDPETEGKLVAAENEYKKLVKDDADKKAAKEVEDKIASIGTVTKNSGSTIKDARSSYEALTPEQKDLVSKEALKALEEAEKAFARISRINEDSEPIHIIASKGDNKGEKNPNTGAPAMSIAPAMLVLAAAAFVLKKRG